MRKKYALKLTIPDKDVEKCFESALHNAVNINTVRCKYKKYNKTGLLEHPYMIRAGGNYKTPWTRDASINTWQAMNFISPKVSRTTLLAVCNLNEKGEIIIEPDSQVWDQIVWATGAYNYYLTTGDEEFIAIARGIIGRALSTHRKNRFNENFGLFVGGSFFNDGIAGYPLPCHQQGNKDSFAPRHPVVETIMCLSTNCLYAEAYRIYSEISTHLGFTDEAETAMVQHEKLKDAINRNLWSDELNRYRYFIYPDGSTDNSQELSGLAFSVLFGICPKEKREQIFSNIITSEGGTVSVWSPFEGLFSDDKPGRHNNVVWPFLNGMMIEAAAREGIDSFAYDELHKITNLYKGSKFRIFEIYSPYTKKAFGGWQSGRVWDSCRHQTWSATCYIGAVVLGLFGIKAETDGLRFTPCIPEKLRDAQLSGLKIRGQDFSVKIKGYGKEIDKFILDGKESESFIRWDGKAHQVEIILK